MCMFILCRASILSLCRTTAWKWLLPSSVHSRCALSVTALPWPQPISERCGTSSPAGRGVRPAHSCSSEVSFQEQTTSAWSGGQIQSGPTLLKRWINKVFHQWLSYTRGWYDVIFSSFLHLLILSVIIYLCYLKPVCFLFSVKNKRRWLAEYKCSLEFVKLYKGQ